VVWIPKRKVLCAADNFYKSFPNLYAIRGTRTRDVMQWVRSVDMMRDLKPHYVVPSHTRPLSGVDAIQKALTNYRDGMQYVHDQTVRYINKGLTPDEIVELVELPPHLVTDPYLQEFYGTVRWSVRAIFDGYLGWFSGRASDLNPIPITERARELRSLAGSWHALHDVAKKAMADGRYQWALEISESLLLTAKDSDGARSSHEEEDVKSLKIEALRAQAATQISSCGRNWYITEAKEVEGHKILSDRNDVLQYSKAASIEEFFAAMSVRLDPYASQDVDQQVHIHFTDIDTHALVHIRHSVCITRIPVPLHAIGEDAMHLKLSSVTFRKLLIHEKNPLVALLIGDIEIVGSKTTLARFFGLFEADHPADHNEPFPAS